MPQFYKWLAGDMRHYDFTYKEGLNVDHLPFNPSGVCEPGGLYFTTLEYVPGWHSWHWSLIADVTIPDDARVYKEPGGTKWKADRIILSNIRPRDEFFRDLDEATVCKMLATSGGLLRYTRQLAQTEAMCLAAVRNTGYALQYVDNQTEAVCRAAVATSPNAHMFVKIPY
jgi:hypothetical protein